MEKAQAAASRKKVFDMIATDKVGFSGYHMPFHAVGFAQKLETGYRFRPEDLSVRYVTQLAHSSHSSPGTQAGRFAIHFLS
jgi:hypothetical protein